MMLYSLENDRRDGRRVGRGVAFSTSRDRSHNQELRAAARTKSSLRARLRALTWPCGHTRGSTRYPSEFSYGTGGGVQHALWVGSLHVFLRVTPRTGVASSSSHDESSSNASTGPELSSTSLLSSPSAVACTITTVRSNSGFRCSGRAPSLLRWNWIIVSRLRMLWTPSA